MVYGVLLTLMLFAALPRFGHGPRPGWRERAAVANLKNLAAAQAQAQARASIDRDRNGRSEFGSFAELAGATPPRGTFAPISPPLLSQRFQRVDAAGRVVRGGYVFALYLPGPDGAWLPELPGGGADPAVDARAAAARWLAYAWPQDYGERGRRTFRIASSGTVYATDLGPDRVPIPGRSGSFDDDEERRPESGALGDVWAVVW